MTRESDPLARYDAALDDVRQFMGPEPTPPVEATESQTVASTPTPMEVFGKPTSSASGTTPEAGTDTVAPGVSNKPTGGRTERVEVSSDTWVAPGSIKPLSHPKAALSTGPKRTANIDKRSLGAQKSKGEGVSNVIRADFQQEEQQNPLGGRFETVEQKVYKNGAKHVYGKDAEGKLRHLSHDEILKFYSHEGDYGSNQRKAQKETAKEAVPQPHRLHTHNDTDTILRRFAERNPHTSVAAELDASDRFDHDPDLNDSELRSLPEQDDMEAQLRAIKGLPHTNAPEGPEAFGRIADLDEDDWDDIFDLDDDEPAYMPDWDGDIAHMPDAPVAGGRIRRLMDKASERMRNLNAWVATQLTMSHNRDRSNVDAEKARRTKLIVGSVLGAVAVGAFVYASARGFDFSHHASQTHGGGNVPPKNPGIAPGNGSGGNVPPHNPGLAAGSGEHAPTTVTLKSGDSPWDEARHQLQLHGNAHPTDAQIQAYDAKLGKANGYSWAEWVKKARHLATGSKQKLPKS